MRGTKAILGFFVVLAVIIALLMFTVPLETKRVVVSYGDMSIYHEYTGFFRNERLRVDDERQTYLAVIHSRGWSVDGIVKGLKVPDLVVGDHSIAKFFAHEPRTTINEDGSNLANSLMMDLKASENLESFVELHQPKVKAYLLTEK